MKRLSNIPSKLLLQAVEDIEEVEKQRSQYTFNFGIWHKPNYTGICEVCAAGAMIANRLNAKPTTCMRPDHYSRSVNNKLRAINMFRGGYIGKGLNWLNKVYFSDVDELDFIFSSSILYSASKHISAIKANFRILSMVLAEQGL